MLEAAKLKIDPQGAGRWRLPSAYRSFLSQMDGGRPGRGAFTVDGKIYVIEGFYAFADAANNAEKLRKAGKLPEGLLPVAFTEGDKPIVFLELEEEGKVHLKPSSRARFDEKGATAVIADNFGEFLDMLGDPNEEGAPAAAAANPWATTSPVAAPKKAKVAPAPKPVAPAKPAPKPAAAKPAAVKAGAKASPSGKAKSAPAKKKAPAKKTTAAKKKTPVKKAAAKKKAPAKKTTAAKKKAPVKKTTAKKKAPAKKTAAKKKAPAKKAATKKATAKKKAKKK